MPIEGYPLNMPLFFADYVDIFSKTNEAIKAYTERWNVKLSECDNGIQLYNFLKKTFDEEYQNASDKEFVKQTRIAEYSKHEHDDNKYISKGFNWFKRGKDFSLKDFLYFEFGTADDVTIGTKEKNFFDNGRFTTEIAIIAAWQMQERRFNDAGKGWAYAKIIEYIQSQLKNQSSLYSNKRKNSINGNNYSQKQIAIAFYCLNEAITIDNAAEILKAYSQTGSVQKLLQKRIHTSNQLTALSEWKTADTKHLQDLEAAKRLISGKKNQQALANISTAITAFKTNFEAHYS